MTIIELTAELHAAAENGSGFLGDYAERYDITDEQAERIAAKSGSAAEFDAIWENEDWWV